MLEFSAEKFSTWRVVKCQGGEGIQDPVSAGVAPVAGFYPDDGNNNLRVYTKTCSRPVKNSGIIFPVGNTTLNAALCQEYFSVFVPL